MPDIWGQLTDAINGFFANEAVQLAIALFLAYLVVLWFAAAFWAYRDMHDRTENLVLPYIAAALIILFTPIGFPFGVAVYKIIRPAERLGEVYERNLAEEALLAEVEAIQTCRGCGRRVHEEWIICPSCRTRLNRVCPNCERLVGLDWSVCAWCGKDFERPMAELVQTPAAAAVPQPAAARRASTVPAREAAPGR